MSLRAKADEKEFIEPTRYCDSYNPLIRRAAVNITKGCLNEREAARKIFYWVRDNIKYELGITSERASETLQKATGSCTHKANLAVALLRCLGIPAGFHVIEVKAREYFGAYCTPRFSQFMNEKSLHTYCAARLDDQWISLDPTDDIRISNATRHLCTQAEEVDFDGLNHAMLKLDPDHVLSDSQGVLASIDHILEKKARVPEVVLRVFNLYMDFLRVNSIWNNSVQESEEAYFAWLREELPMVYSNYLLLCEQLKAASWEGVEQNRLAPRPLSEVIAPPIH